MNQPESLWQYRSHTPQATSINYQQEANATTRKRNRDNVGVKQ